MTTAVSHPAILGRPPTRLGRYRQALATYSDARLGAVAQELSWRWPTFLAVTLAVTAPIVAALHVLETIGGRRGAGLLAGVAFLLPAVALGLFLIGVVGWAYWHVRVDPTKIKPYVVALLAFALTVGVCLEAFAGASLLLWRHGAASPLTTAGAPNLWATERIYAWQLANAIPLLSVPSTLSWSRPRLFTDELSGTLLLIFKLIVLAPIIHLAFAGYRTAQNGALSQHLLQERRKARQHGGRIPSALSSRAAWGLCVLLGLLVILGATITTFLSRPTSSLNRWYADLVPSHVSIAGVTASLSWLDGAFQVLAALALLALCAIAVGVVAVSGLASVSRLPAVAAALTSFIFLIGLVIVAHASLTVVFLRAGLASAHPPVPSGAEVGTALNFYSWHLADAIPGLSVPETLNWPLHHEFVDYWNRTLLLLCKLALVTILAAPVARVVRGYSKSRSIDIRPSVTAAAEFDETLEKISARLDAYEEVVLRPQQLRVGGGLSTISARRSNFDFARFREESDAAQTVRRLLDQIETDFDHVTALFGEGQVKSRAAAAIVAVERRFDSIGEFGSFGRRTLGDLSSPGTPLETSRQEAAEAIDAFKGAASAALRDSAPVGDAAGSGS